LGSSGIFDGILDLSRQCPAILFAQGREDRPRTVAGTKGESQKENKP
jgi:hypothetical protein